MYKNNRLLAIIPARSGSKGIKDKNIKNINNKPLMAYTIEASIKSKIFDDIIVSTDSFEYRSIARSYGAWVPFLRSKELATDTTSILEVILNVLNKLENIGKTYDYFVLLKPTSPLRNEDDIIESVNLLLENKANSVVSVCEVENGRSLNVKLNLDGSLDNAFNDVVKLRSQNLNKEYRINGAIYICNIKYFLYKKSFYKEKSYPYVMDKIKSIDIEDMYQFRFAEFLIKSMWKGFRLS